MSLGFSNPLQVVPVVQDDWSRTKSDHDTVGGSSIESQPVMTTTLSPYPLQNVVSFISKRLSMRAAVVMNLRGSVNTTPTSTQKGTNRQNWHVSQK
jgi:hypothetical protein